MICNIGVDFFCVRNFKLIYHIVSERPTPVDDYKKINVCFVYYLEPTNLIQEIYISNCKDQNTTHNELISSRFISTTKSHFRNPLNY